MIKVEKIKEVKVETKISLTKDQQNDWKKKLKKSAQLKAQKEKKMGVLDVERKIEKGEVKVKELSRQERHKILKGAGMTNGSQRMKFAVTSVPDKLFRSLQEKELKLDGFKAEVMKLSTKKTEKKTEKKEVKSKGKVKKTALGYVRKSDSKVVDKKLTALFGKVRNLLQDGATVEKGSLKYRGLLLQGYKRVKKGSGGKLMTAMKFVKNGKYCKVWLPGSSKAERVVVAIKKVNKK